MDNPTPVAPTKQSVHVLLMTAVLVWLPIALMMLAAQWIAHRRGFSLAMLTREPATALKGKYWVGMISNVGVLMWCVTAAVCFFSFFAVRDGSQKAWRVFFFCSGLLTSCLLIDDTFMLHDGMLWAIARIPEKAVVGTWGLGGIAWILYFRRTILEKTEFLLLGLACTFFALSLVFDMDFIHIRDNYRHLGEDGFKLMGIATWGVYHGRTCLNVVRQAIGGR